MIEDTACCLHRRCFGCTRVPCSVIRCDHSRRRMLLGCQGVHISMVGGVHGVRPGVFLVIHPCGVHGMFHDAPWQTPNYAATTDCYDITVEGGASNLSVVS